MVEAAVSSIGQPEEISAKKNSVQLVYSPRDFSIGGEEVRTVDQEHRVAEALRKQLAKELSGLQITSVLAKPEWSNTNLVFLTVAR